MIVIYFRNSEEWRYGDNSLGTRPQLPSGWIDNRNDWSVVGWKYRQCPINIQITFQRCSTEQSSLRPSMGDCDDRWCCWRADRRTAAAAAVVVGRTGQVITLSKKLSPIWIEFPYICTGWGWVERLMGAVLCFVDQKLSAHRTERFADILLWNNSIQFWCVATMMMGWVRGNRKRCSEGIRYCHNVQ